MTMTPAAPALISSDGDFGVLTKRLAKYGAHNRNAVVRSPLGTVFEITPSLCCPVLFDFMGAADVIDLLQSTEILLCL
jgi:predicted membrane protein